MRKLVCVLMNCFYPFSLAQFLTYSSKLQIQISESVPWLRCSNFLTISVGFDNISCHTSVSLSSLHHYLLFRAQSDGQLSWREGRETKENQENHTLSFNISV
jgi:hypothetical protein